MKLLAISNPEFIPDEAEIINSLFREGLVCLHMRKPESAENQLKELLMKIETAFIERIAIHQHHILANDFGITRLHFTEKDRKLTSDKKLGYLNAAGYQLSTSIHDLNDMAGLSKHFSYTFLGPVFDSISKTGYKSAFPADFYLDAKTKRIPVIALGGIDSTNLEKVKAMNFDGAAILGTLWKEPKSAQYTFRKLKERCSTALDNGTNEQPPGSPNERTAPKGRHIPAQGPDPGNPTPEFDPVNPYQPPYKKLPMIDKLQFISNQTDEISHLESIQLALDAGCRWIQLRIKNELPEHILKTASEAKILCDNYHAKLIINDFPAIAKQVGAYGLHLGLEDMSISDARKMVGKMIIGGTANTLEDVLNRINEGADYVGLGPYRFTSTKQKLSPTLGLEGYDLILNTLKELGYTIPVIAIGGIHTGDIPALLQTGVHGVAMSGSILGAMKRQDVVQKIKEILC